MIWTLSVIMRHLKMNNDLVKKILKGTQLGINNKVVKWIIEIAAE
jgi:hypothetical protein